MHRLTAPQLRARNSRGWRRRACRRRTRTGRWPPCGRHWPRGPLTRSQLRERVAAAGVRTEGQAMVHILALASNLGLIVRGPVAGRDQAFVLVRDWLGAPPHDRPRCGARGAGPAIPGRARPGVGPRPRAVGGHQAARCPARPRPVRRGTAPRTPGRPAGGPRNTAPPCHRRCCSAPSTRYCSAGLPGIPSSARTG